MDNSKPVDIYFAKVEAGITPDERRRLAEKMAEALIGDNSEAPGNNSRQKS